MIAQNELHAFYEQHNPTKLDGEEDKMFIASLLTKYKGREQGLLDEVTQKYAVPQVIHVARLEPTVYAIIYKYKLDLYSTVFIFLFVQNRPSLVGHVLYNIEYYGQVCRQGQVPYEMLHNREDSQRARHPLRYQDLWP